MTSKDIQKKLNNYYTGNCLYKVPNAFIFKWESDFFVQRQSKLCYEFEIKVTKADFKKDFDKKDKHQILQTGELNGTKYKRPNKFYYIAPKGVIDANDIPSYAGFVEVQDTFLNDLCLVKDAPNLHKEKLQLEPILCQKFYFYWLSQLDKNRALELQIKKLKQDLLDRVGDVL